MRPAHLQSTLLAAAAFGALSLAGAGVAHADIVNIGFQSGNGKIFTGATGSGNARSSGNVIGFSSFSGSGVATPPDPAPNMTAGAKATADKGFTGSASVYVSETNILGPLGAFPLQSALAVSSVDSNMKVTESTYIDPKDHVYGEGTLLASASFSGAKANSRNFVTKTPKLIGPYSLTAVFTFTATTASTDPTSSGGSITTTKVPEPGSLALLGTGLIGLTLVAGRRRRRG